jgi:hypothetical protein
MGNTGGRLGWRRHDPCCAGRRLADRRAAVLKLVGTLQVAPRPANSRGTQGALGRPFGRPAANDRWAPVLLLNATSVDTGRRVVASELLPTYGDGTRLFAEAYDTFVELGRTFHRDGSELKDDAEIKLADIPLSTAAALSARFPIVSPYGALRNPDASEAADRVVDGGYFENDGVTTAFELARAMVGREMRPIIIHITNDPIGRYDTRNGEGNVVDYARAPDLPKPRVRLFRERIRPSNGPVRHTWWSCCRGGPQHPAREGANGLCPIPGL